MAEAPEPSIFTAQSDTRTETVPPTSSAPSLRELPPSSPTSAPSLQEPPPSSPTSSAPSLREQPPSSPTSAPSLQEPPPSSPTSAPSLQEPPPSSPTSSAPSLREPPPSSPTSSAPSLQEPPPSSSTSAPSLREQPPSSPTSSAPSLQEPPPSSPTSAPSLREPPPSSPTSSAPSLRELSVLPVTRWYLLGLQLGVDQHDLEVIERNYPRDNEMCKLKMFGVWLRTDPSATYEKLVRGLAAIGKKNVAEPLCNARGIPLSVLSDVAPRPPTPPPTPQQPPAPPQCIADYASFLKDKYQRMDTLPESDWPPSIGRQYTRLAMIEIERSEGLPNAKFADTMEHDYLHGKIDNICERKQGIELQEAFLPLRTGEGQLKILMDGAPGVGKTTLSRKACKDWASGELLQNYHLVVLLPLRERGVKNAQTVEDLFFADNQQLQQEVVRHIRQTSGEHLLLIFDGYDELSFEQRTEDSLFLDIIQGKQLHKCSVLVTSRPYASDYLQQSKCINRHVEVLGFTEEQIQTCIRQKITDQAKASELLRMLKERLDITSLCYTPLNCAIVLYVYEREQYTLPSTLTGLYEVFILNTLRRHARHLSPRDQRLLQSARSIENIPPSLKMQLDSLSRLAFDALAGDNMVFNYFDLAPVFPEADFETNFLGLMTAVKGFTTSGTEIHYQFLHLSIQEFLAARWAATQNPAKIFLQLLGNKRFQMMLLFLAGLSGLNFASSDKIFSSSIQLPRSKDFENSIVIRHFLFLAHLIFESWQFSLYRTLSNAVTYRNLNLSCYKFSLFDCFLLAHFLDWSGCSWETLDLSYCGLTKHSLEIFQQVSSEHTRVKEVHVSYNTPGFVAGLPSAIPAFLKRTEKLVMYGSPSNLNLQAVVTGLKHLTVLRVSCKEKEAANLHTTLAATFTALTHNTSLEVLDMTWNGQLMEGDSEAMWCAVERMLTVNTTLKVLKMRRCRLDTTLMKYIAAGLSQNRSLQSLDIAHTTVSAAGFVNILRELEQVQNHNIAEAADTHTTSEKNFHVSIFPIRVTGIGEVSLKGHTLHVDVDPHTETTESILEFFAALNFHTTLSYHTLSVGGLSDTAAKYMAAGLTENKSVKTLVIGWNNISSAGGEAIFRSLEHNTSLEELDMTFYRLGDSEAVGCAVERMLRVNTTLKVLKMDDCGLDNTVMKHIAAGLSQNRSLRSLDITHTTVSAAGFVNIMRELEQVQNHNIAEAVDTHTTSEKNFQVSIFPISVTGIGEVSLKGHKVHVDVDPHTETTESILELFTALNHTTLSYHTLSVSRLTDTAANYMAAGLAENKSVKMLVISHSNISSAGGKAIFGSLEHNTSLEELDMSHNRRLALGDSEAVGCAVERMLRANTTLKVLKMDHCGLNNRVMKHIASGLEHNTVLAELSIAGNNGYVHLFKALHHNTSLRKLDIRQSRLTMLDTEALAEMPSHNRSLTELNVMWCIFPKGGLRVVARGLLQNTTLQTLRIDDSWRYKTVLEREIERLQRTENIDTSQWKLRITEDEED